VSVGFAIWSVLSGLVLAWFTLRLASFRTHFQLLRDVSVKEPVAGWPLVSLIVPACNEEETIAEALRSLLRIEYPALELIAVEDRSTDRTREVIEGVARDDARVKLVSVETLPPGWLGKVHALYQGVNHAKGDWFLFSDADVHYAPASISKAITHVDSQELDFLTVVPAIHARTFFLKCLVVQFIHMAATTLNLKRVRDRRATDSPGGGAFNLVSREAYERSGRLEWLKLDVIDDSGLAMVVKEAGAKCDAIGGLGEIEIEWYPNATAFVRGLEKNAFAIFQYSLMAVVLFMIWNVILFCGIVIAPALSGSVLVQIFSYIMLVSYIAASMFALRKLIPFSSWVAVTLPLTSLVFPLIGMRSAVLFLKRGGIFWRGTFYSRNDLIANQRFKLFQLLFKREFAALSVDTPNHS
jgi:glycosyltransferase involved in cell wall biosynthesis